MLCKYEPLSSIRMNINCIWFANRCALLILLSKFQVEIVFLFCLSNYSGEWASIVLHHWGIVMPLFAESILTTPNVNVQSQLIVFIVQKTLLENRLLLELLISFKYCFWCCVVDDSQLKIIFRSPAAMCGRRRLTIFICKNEEGKR